MLFVRHRKIDKPVTRERERDAGLSFRKEEDDLAWIVSPLFDPFLPTSRYANISRGAENGNCHNFSSSLIPERTESVAGWIKRNFRCDFD